MNFGIDYLFFVKDIKVLLNLLNNLLVYLIQLTNSIHQGRGHCILLTFIEENTIWSFILSGNCLLFRSRVQTGVGTFL